MLDPPPDGRGWTCPACGSACAATETACRTCGAFLVPPGSNVRTATAVESCRVERWRGYVTSTFYAVTDGGYVIAESKSFRWRRSAPPPDRGRARGAYDELVERLAAEGWEPSGEPGREWYRTRFVRASSVPVAVQARPTIVRPRAEQPRPDPGQRPVLGGG